MPDDLSWLETWRGEFDVAEMMDPGRWERHRLSVRHPATIFSETDIDRARERVRHHDWGKLALDRLMARVASAGPVTEAWARTYVPSTTPYTPHFTMCPKCEFAPMHGAYDWSPSDPEHIRCKGCGTVYPNDAYPEDLVFQSRFDPSQRITLYGGKSWPAYGYAAIHSSFSGNARIRQCRHAANTAEDLALAYALTGDAGCAEAAATILRRFADVHPRYLVHSSYGDIADMDPKVAAPRVNDLPEDEWCPPGNVPDRKLYPGYWATLRWGTAGGMEGTSLQKVILAYDLVAGTLPDADRRHIERDLLLDAAVLQFSDHVINNKTGMNRCAVGMIGLACGDPLLVRFGLDGFVKAVRDWWLPDGGTSESIGYAGMMLHGVWRVAEALKRYEDPEGVDLPPARLSRVNLYDWPRYRAVWQGTVRPLLPSLDYPLLADNRLPCHLSAMFSDLVARNYPTPGHRRLQRDIAGIPRCYAGRIAQFWYGGNLDTSAAFYREGEGPEGAARFSNDVGPYLNIGTLRTGRDGQGSAVILSAADFKGHHHLDHLNLYYWKDGREWLTDLGYLWDMQEQSPKVRRTLAHQTALVDGKDQKTKGRRGTFHLFSTGSEVKVMEASSDAYEEAPVYRRTVAVIGSGPSEYVVDIFRVRGGRFHDLVMHGPDRSLSLSGLRTQGAEEDVYDLTETVAGKSEQTWTATWKPGGGKPFRMHVPASGEETVFIGQGFGQRKAVDAGATVPYVVRRRTGRASVFVTVYAQGNAVKVVRVAHLDKKTLTAVVEVTTSRGKDLIVSAGPGRPPLWGLKVGRRNLDFDGRFGFISGKRRLLVGGRYLSIGDAEVEIDRMSFSGPVLETYVSREESGLVTDGNPAEHGGLVGKHIFVADGEGVVRVYPVLGLVVSDGRPVLITRRGDEGYDIRGGVAWSAWHEARVG